MNITLSSKKLSIIDTGLVYLADADADLTLYFEVEEGHDLSLELTFIKDSSGTQAVNRSQSGNKIKYQCVNFSDTGTGTTEPVEVATVQGKTLYILFWSFLLGDMKEKKRPRKVEYTVFLEG